MAEVGSTTANSVRHVRTRVGSTDVWFAADVYSWTCTSHTDGNLSGGPSQRVTGKLAQVKFVPTTGATQPTNAFDVTAPITEGGADILIGVGANVPQDPTDTGCIRTPLTTDGGFVILVDDVVSISASACGSQKVFTVYLIVLP